MLSKRIPTLYLVFGADLPHVYVVGVAVPLALHHEIQNNINTIWVPDLTAYLPQGVKAALLIFTVDSHQNAMFLHKLHHNRSVVFWCYLYGFANREKTSKKYGDAIQICYA